jgi:hydrogenase expression/formation protein HypE
MEICIEFKLRRRNKLTNDIITLAHGSGGRAQLRLINDVIKKRFSNPVLNKMEDGAVLPRPAGRIVLTTDSFVVSPIFFSGGDIGRLSICGTVNDLAAMGAKPFYITAGLIIEEGLRISEFERILASMQKTAKEAGVIIVGGDTKVVEKGKADKIFINTAGMGIMINPGLDISASNAAPGDAVIISGTLGDHEISILKDREGIGFEADIKSDCAPLNKMTAALIKAGIKISAMRDPTRGGLSAVLNEIASASGVEIDIQESEIPVKKAVAAICSVLGFEPLYLANEGKMAIFCQSKQAKRALAILKKTKYGRDVAIIGRVTGKNKKGKVVLKTGAGGERILLMPEGEQLPRIC